jgi:hypothetical protein
MGLSRRIRKYLKKSWIGFEKKTLKRKFFIEITEITG